MIDDSSAPQNLAPSPPAYGSPTMGQPAHGLAASFAESPHSPSLIHAAIAHIESALEKSRVVFMGNALDGAAEVVIARGARLCHVLDPDARRVATAAQRNGERRITYSQRSEASFRDGAYDVAIIQDLAEEAVPADLLDGLRRALSNEGIAVVAASAEGGATFLGNPASRMGYADFVRSIRAVFPRAIIAAQTPFLASAIVRLDLDEAPTPALDNAFLEGEADEVSQYLAICGNSEILQQLDLEEMSVVQFKARSVLARGQAEQEARLNRAERRATALEEELEAERNRPRAPAQSSELEPLKEKLDTSERELERVRRERKWADDRVRRLERELEEALEAQEELAKAQERIVTLQGHLKDSEDEVDELTDKVYQLEPELSRLKSALEAAQGATSDREVEELEKKLAERGQRVLELEQQLAELDVVLRAMRLEAPPRPSGAEGPEAKLLLLSSELAAREAELQSLRWTLAAQTASPRS